MIDLLLTLIDLIFSPKRRSQWEEFPSRVGSAGPPTSPRRLSPSPMAPAAKLILIGVGLLSAMGALAGTIVIYGFGTLLWGLGGGAASWPLWVSAIVTIILWIVPVGIFVGLRRR